MKRVVCFLLMVIFTCVCLSSCTVEEPVVVVEPKVLQYNENDLESFWKSASATVFPTNATNNAVPVIAEALKSGYFVPDLAAHILLYHTMETNSNTFCFVSPKCVDFVTSIAKVHLDLENITVEKHKHLYNSDYSIILKIPGHIKNIADTNIVANRVAIFTLGNIAALSDSITFMDINGLCPIEKDAYADDFNYMTFDIGEEKDGFYYFALNPDYCNISDDVLELSKATAFRLIFKDEFSDYNCEVYCGDFNFLLDDIEVT